MLKVNAKTLEASFNEPGQVVHVVSMWRPSFRSRSAALRERGCAAQGVCVCVCTLSCFMFMLRVRAIKIKRLHIKNFLIACTNDALQPT